MRNVIALIRDALKKKATLPEDQPLQKLIALEAEELTITFGLVIIICIIFEGDKVFKGHQFYSSSLLKYQ